MVYTNLAKYHLWAGTESRKILQDLTPNEFKTDLGDELGSVEAKVQHILLALLFCFLRLNIDFPFFQNDSEKEIFRRLHLLSKNDLLTCWEEADKTLVSSMQVKGSTVTIKRSDGDTFCLLREDFFLQYILHTVYHRGQLNYCLKALGKERINADYLFYFDNLDRQMDKFQ